MKKAAAVPIRVNDAAQLLSGSANIAGAHLLIGVPNSASGFQQALVISKDAAGWTYRISIPYNTPVKLVVASAFFQVGNSAGIALPQFGTSVPLLVPSGQPPATVMFSILGGR